MLTFTSTRSAIFYERNSTVHAVVLSVKRPRPFNPVRLLRAYKRKYQGFSLTHTANRKRSGNPNRHWPSLNSLVRVKRNQRILLSVEEVLASQLVVLHAAPGIHTGCLNLDIQNALRNIVRWIRQRGVPLFKRASIDTDALTANFTVLCSGVIAKTGTCARLTEPNTANPATKKRATRTCLVIPIFTAPFYKISAARTQILG
jgi:hypothetical protein